MATEPSIAKQYMSINDNLLARLANVCNSAAVPDYAMGSWFAADDSSAIGVIEAFAATLESRFRWPEKQLIDENRAQLGKKTATHLDVQSGFMHLSVGSSCTLPRYRRVAGRLNELLAPPVSYTPPVQRVTSSFSSVLPMREQERREQERALVFLFIITVCAFVNFVFNIRAGVYYNKQGDYKRC
jgi:hypothetical protein